ncbi:polysaccharide biosynthesis protein [Candidatus Viadribacter manganicus]|nr:polysaccharide biosynthesis protein [Candidatus Viadribacter manganicus]
MPSEFLQRSEGQFEFDRIGAFFANKRVLITGAAGSVGSALSMRLAALGCAHLALLDQFDHGLLEVVEAVRRAHPSLPTSEILCDVRDPGRLETSIRRAEPDIVIHAAALKHVHMGERHPVECVLTNLVGVRNTAIAAANAGATQFVLISSDKAAAPTCVMGATKRLAELYLGGFARERTRAMVVKAVRFGNVLGSQGSVLPRFRAQIDAGGPLEVTHPKMERFFMSSDEAVGLILSVAALEAEAGTYFMELGEAVSIVDLGRRMIAKSGKAIDMAFTGLRSGEKLSEQLIDEYESIEASGIANVYRVRSKSADAYLTAGDVAHLETLARTMDNAVLRQRVFAQLDQRLHRDVRPAG